MRETIAGEERRAVGHFPRRAGAPSGARPRVVARAFVELIRLHRRLRAG